MEPPRSTPDRATEHLFREDSSADNGPPSVSGAKSLLLGRLGLEPGVPVSQLHTIQKQETLWSSQGQDYRDGSKRKLIRMDQVRSCLQGLATLTQENTVACERVQVEKDNNVWGLSEGEQPISPFLGNDEHNVAAETQSYIVKMGLSDAVDQAPKGDEIDLEALGRLTETEMAQAGLSALQRVKIGVSMGRIAAGVEAMHTLLSQLGMAQYVQLFVDNDVDLECFALLTDADIVELGVENEFHRQVLLNAAQPSTLMQQCLHSMLSPEYIAAEEKAADVNHSGADSNFQSKSENVRSSPKTTRQNQILTTRTVEEELEGCKQIIREMLLERSTVISRLCHEIRVVEMREASLIRILESGGSERNDEAGHTKSGAENGTGEHNPGRDEMDGGRGSSSSQETSRVDEAIMMLLAALARLSGGSSSKLQDIVLEHCAPLICGLADHSLLLDWCSAILKQELGGENRLMWAVRSKLAESMLSALVGDAQKRASMIETSLSFGASPTADTSSQRGHQVPAVVDQNELGNSTIPANVSTIRPNESSGDLKRTFSATPQDQNGEQTTINSRLAAAPTVIAVDAKETASSFKGFSPLRDTSPRGQLLTKLPAPVDVDRDRADQPSPLPLKNAHAEDDGTSQAISLTFDSLGFPVVAHAPPDSLQLPGVAGWRVRSIAGVTCRFKRVEELQELFWREQGTGAVAMVLEKGGDGDEDSYSRELTVPAGTLVSAIAGDVPASEADEQCYLVVLRRIPRAKASSLSEAVGVGMTLQKERDGQFRVVALLAGGAAAESGRVGQGDLVRSINGREVQGRSVEDVMQLIKGAPGTRVAILFAPGDSKALPMRPHRTVPGWKPKMGEIKVQVASGSGLRTDRQPASIFCQLRVLSTTLDEELVGVGRAGVEIGMRVHKSRFRKEKEASRPDHEAAGEEVGTVVNIQDEGMACQVLWDDATEQWYATGLAAEYDLEVSPEVTTMCTSAGNLRWDSVLTLGVRELDAAFLECSVWDGGTLLGETILELSSLADAPWEVVEKRLQLQDPDTGIQPSVLVAASTSSNSPQNIAAHHDDVGGSIGSVHLAVCWVPMPAAPTVNHGH